MSASVNRHRASGFRRSAPIPLHGRKWSLTLTIPPLAAVFFVNEA